MGGRCRIGFLNVLGLTVAKSVQIKNPMMVSGGDGSEKEVIQGLVETHEKFNRVEWGEGVEYISTMRGQDDKRGGGISLIKGKDGCTWEKIDNARTVKQ